MIPACNATVHPSLKDSAVDDMIDILHITGKALRHKCTKDEICEIYIERDKAMESCTQWSIRLSDEVDSLG